MQKRLLLSVLLLLLVTVTATLAVQLGGLDDPRQGLFSLIDRALADGDDEKMAALYMGASIAAARLDAQRLTEDPRIAPSTDGLTSVVSAFGMDGHWDRCVYMRDWGLKYCFDNLLDCTSFGTNQTPACGNGYQSCNAIVNASFNTCKGG